MSYDAYDSTNAHSREKLAAAAGEQVKAYQERTAEQVKTARADRLTKTRMDALAMSYDILKQEPGTFSLGDVKTLADLLVDYAREGNQPVDGTPLHRFHGK